MNHRKYLLTIVVLYFLINTFYFSLPFLSHGPLYFNDFAPPINHEQVGSYLAGTDIYNLNSNLGSPRLNFLNELAPLTFIWLLSIVFSYNLGLVLFYITGFTFINVVNCYFFYRISSQKIASAILGLLSTLNLWSFDRLQQGHYFNLTFFLPLCSLFIYILFFSNDSRKKYWLPIIILFSFATYYHYSFILLYLIGFKFIADLIVLEKSATDTIKEYITIGVSAILLMSLFIFPYILSIVSFTNLSSSVSTANSLQLFSWQSTILSTFFQLRTGMASFQTLNLFSYPLYLTGFIFLFLFSLPFWSKRELSKEIPLYFSLVLTALLSFGYWLNPDLAINFLYKIPTMTIFRDMNKFAGIFFLLLLFLVSLNIKHVKGKLMLLFFPILFIFIPFLHPYEYFAKIESSNYFFPKDGSKYASIAFPSSPLVYFRESDKGFHRYLPILNNANNVRTLYLPYAYQTDDASISKTSFFRDLYTNWNSMTEDSVYSFLSAHGVKYVYYYRRYKFTTGDPNYDLWYKTLDIESKFSEENIIHSSDEEIVYRIPGDIKPIIYSSEGDLTFKILSPTRISITDTYKGTDSINVLITYDPNWRLYAMKQDLNCNGIDLLCRARVFANHYLFFLHPVIGQQSKILEGVGMSWTVNTSIDQGYVKKLCSSTDQRTVEFRLLYLPAIYFLLGLVITLCTLLGFVGLLSASPRVKKHHLFQ